METSNYVKNKEKQTNDLERYQVIVDYFAENPDRIDANKDDPKNDYFSDIAIRVIFAGSNYPELNDKAKSLSHFITNLGLLGVKN